MRLRVTVAVSALTFASLATGCALPGSSKAQTPAGTGVAIAPTITRPSPDPRIGLAPGLMNAGEAAWNMRLLAKMAPQQDFVGAINSDLAFLGNYVIDKSAKKKIAETRFTLRQEGDSVTEMVS